MTPVLHIADAVVTGEVLARRHQGEEVVCVAAAAIVTPTGWDYLRQKRLRLVRQEESPPPPPAAAGALIAEVEVPRQTGEGRCQQPQRSCGCVDEEFGSGFVEPGSCRDCAIYELKRSGDERADCAGCNRHKAIEQLADSGQGIDPEQLVREVTALVLHRLED